MHKLIRLTAVASATFALLHGSGIEAKLQEKQSNVLYPESFGEVTLQSHQMKAGSLEEQAGMVVQTLKNAGVIAQNESLSLLKKSSSLNGHHYYFQQTVNQVPIYAQGLVVSLDKSHQKVVRVHDRLINIGAYKVDVPSSDLDSKTALQKSWDFFQPTGELTAYPDSELVYVIRGKQLTLAYQVDLSLTEPQGSWRQFVAVNTGKVLNTTRLDTPKKITADSYGFGGKVQARTAMSKVTNLKDALSRFSSTAKPQTAKEQATQRLLVDGTALVFDPDPRTALNDETLSNRSTEAEFDPAYVSRPLRDIDFNDTDGIYSLVGPWVQIVDFEAPATRPTTTNDGQWTGKRGEAQFYDAMSYYHIDENQRHLQALGFSGDKAIQNGSIEVDADAVSGDDNSYYDPINNRLAFGHGGVPDNEDADVIIHEYGHAIHSDINPMWGGVDTGAIGEGFGDYWAGSYTYAKTNGQTFFPEWVFTWDGHNDIWPGRVMNRTSYRYDPNETYGAHEAIDGIPDYADELWSTPLFQSMVELTDAGYNKDEVDQIIIEAQFGLGFGISMPDMADSIVRTAFAMFPNESHASVFFNWFKQMNILQEQPLSVAEVVYENAGFNDVADPGETIEIKIPLANPNLFAATGVAGTLSSQDANVVIQQNTSDFADIGAFETVASTDNYVLTIDDALACGSQVALNYAVTGQLATDPAQTITEIYDLELPVGSFSLVSNNQTTSQAIPDNEANGVRSTLSISGAGSVIDQRFRVYVDITHTYRGDLQLSLTSPEGTTVILKAPDGDEAVANLVGYFPTDFLSAENLNAFDGENLNGEWQLAITDNAAEDVGTLNEWGIELSSPAVCEQTAIFPENIVFVTAGVNNAADPGETVEFQVPITNPTTYSATAISATVTAKNNTVVVSQATSEYNNIDSAATVSNTNNFVLSLDEIVACGSRVAVTFDITGELSTNPAQPISETYDVEFITGTRAVNSGRSIPNVAIPDNDTSGVRSTHAISNAGDLIDDNFQVFVDISHTNVSELTLLLTSPEGTEVVLQAANTTNRTGNLTGSFPADYESQGDLSVFEGEDLNGDWTLTVIDSSATETGTLNEWGFNYSSPSTCEDIPNRDDERRENSREILYALAAVLLVGVNVGSSQGLLLLLLLPALARRRRR